MLISTYMGRGLFRDTVVHDYIIIHQLELVVVHAQVRHILLKTLARADRLDKVIELAILVTSHTAHERPVVEHTLREGLTTRGPVSYTHLTLPTKA